MSVKAWSLWLYRYKS